MRRSFLLIVRGAGLLDLTGVGFAEMDDRYATGSSIMPQKKNSDVAELIRGPSAGGIAGVIADHSQLMKGLPLHRLMGTLPGR